MKFMGLTMVLIPLFWENRYLDYFQTLDLTIEKQLLKRQREGPLRKLNKIGCDIRSQKDKFIMRVSKGIMTYYDVTKE